MSYLSNNSFQTNLKSNSPLDFSRYLLVLFFVSTFSFNLVAQMCDHSHHNHYDHHDHSTGKKDALKFVPNHNQWDDAVEYRIEVGGMNTLFMESNALTWLFKDQKVVMQMHNNPREANNMTMDAHAYKMRFIGSGEPTLTGFKEQRSYHNYFLGNDPNKWAGKVPVYEGVTYDELYDGIQMKAYSQYGNFKYDFIIDPGIDPAIIQMEYDGVDDLSLVDGTLQIKTSVEDITEQKPYAYQIIDSVLHEVVCEYAISNNTVSFSLPNGYDSTVPLIIDPVVVAATLSGSLTDNWGFSATYDNVGNIYAGGISFGANYPTTTGAFQITHAGGSRDIAVTKYVPDGSAQIYATYIGGSNNEQPHSMIVDFNGQLCIYGTSNSTNYPTTSNAYQTIREGLSDIIITKLNAAGSALVGSTYLGGDANDGINEISPPGQSYDDNRGEIVLDAQGNIYIASCSSSNNFPTTNNAFQTTYNGDQEGVVCKLNTDLSTLFWSTYLGEDNDDAAMGLRVADNGAVIVYGTTRNTDFPVGNNGYQSTWPGGTSNTFVIILSPSGQNIEQGTFFGAEDGTDYGYFVDIDEDNLIHIYGQTTGTIDVTPNTYFANLGSKQFIAGLTPNLDDLVYSTVIGRGPNSSGFDFVPVAFMVDKCNGIYFSAFDAQSGLPTTPDAIDVGDDYFYLAKLSPLGEELDYATYYGNSFHVDGGTSRFDKGGIVYQAVCSCSPGSVMATLPNCYSNDSSPNCSIGVFKIDFEIETTTAAAFAEPSTSGCVPLTIDFLYTGSDGDTFFWDFGTGDTSTEENPSYTFEDAGTYTVMQIVNAPNTCNQVDTFLLQIDVLNNNSTLKDTAFCAGSVDLFLDVSTANADYEWQDGATGPTYTVQDVGTYWVDVNVGNCVRRDSFVVTTNSEIELDIGDDQTLCDVNSIALDASNVSATSYQWSSGETSPFITVTSSGIYEVTVTDAFGCSSTDEVEINLGFAPQLELGPDITICDGESVVLTPTISAGDLIWQDGSTSNTFTVTSDGLYWVEGTNDGCTSVDSLLVTYSLPPTVSLGPDQSFCEVNSVTLDATNIPGATYLWSTGEVNPIIDVTSSGIYTVTVANELGCSSSDEVEIALGFAPDIDFGPDTTLCQGDTLILTPTISAGFLEWQNGSDEPSFFVTEAGLYWVVGNDQGCIGYDSLFVTYDPVPEVTLGPDLFYCDVDLITLDATDINTTEYEWSTGTNDATIDVTSSGEYVVTVYNSFGCTTVDEVQVTLGESPVVDLGPDISLCDGETFVLTAASTTNVLEWQDGSTANTYTVNTGGLYWVEGDNEGCTDADSLFVIYNPLPIVDFDTEDVDCSGNNSGIIEPFFPQSVGDFNFEWSNGSTEIALSELTAGNYNVSITDSNNCFFETTIEITEPDPINLMVDFLDVECFGDKSGLISLAGSSGGSEPYLYSFNGQEFSEQQTFYELDGGTYNVALLDANDCISSTEIDIYEPPEVTLSAGEDKFIDLGDSVRIDGYLLPDFGQELYWESLEYIDCDTCLRPIGRPLNTADYIITYRDTTTGCIQIDTMIITVAKPRSVYIPNVFSPGTDGVNDRFFPFGDQSVESVNYMKIFDRWGEFVYEADNFAINDPGPGWDGKFKGKEMQPAVFVYVIEVLFKDGVVKNYKGDFTIVR